MTGSATIALTGATGFVGGAVLRAATSAGLSVRALYRRAPGHGRAIWIRGHLGCDTALADLCEGADVVIHVAGLTAAASDVAFHEVNVLGAAKLCGAARRAGAKRFVLVSSQAARQPGLSPYAMSKRLGEAAVRRAAGDMDVVIVRPPAVFGPGDEATAPILDAIRRGMLPVPGGRGWRERRFAAVMVRDLADELLALARAPQVPNDVVELASFDALSWQVLANAARAAGHPVRLVPVPPAVLAAAGAVTDAVGKLRGRAYVFGRGKAREMTHPDWTTQSAVASQGDLAAALRPLLEARLGGSQKRDETHDKALTGGLPRKRQAPQQRPQVQARHS